MCTLFIIKNVFASTNFRTLENFSLNYLLDHFYFPYLLNSCPLLPFDVTADWVTFLIHTICFFKSVFVLCSLYLSWFFSFYNFFLNIVILYPSRLFLCIFYHHSRSSTSYDIHEVEVFSKNIIFCSLLRCCIVHLSYKAHLHCVNCYLIFLGCTLTQSSTSFHYYYRLMWVRLLFYYFSLYVLQYFCASWNSSCCS